MIRNIALCALMAGASACATSTVHADELIVGTPLMRQYIDPGKDFSNTGSQQYYNAFDPLIEKDYTSTEAAFRPGLATAWKQVSPTEFELTIRDDVKFHNGDPMTADDVVFSLDRIINQYTVEYAPIKRQFFENWERVEKIDERTVRITSRRPEALFEVLANTQQGYIVPRDYIMGLTGEPDVAEPGDFEAFALRPVGTGPYRVAEFVPGETLVYERFDDFWGTPAPFDRVELRRIAELSTRIAALKNGEVDLISHLPPDQIATIEADPDLHLEGMVTALFHVLMYNANNPAMADKRLRQALNLAVDRDLLNEALWQGKAIVPSTHTYPQYGALHMPELETFRHDPEAARRLVAESSYDGTPIRFDTSVSSYTNGLLAAQAIQQMWSDIGVEMKLNVTERFTAADPDMQSRNWSNPMYFADPTGSFGTMWAPTGIAVSRGSWTPTEEFGPMWERFRYSTDTETRRQAYAEIMDYIAEEAPFLVLYRPFEAYAMRADLGWKPKPGHIPYVLDFRAGSFGD